jgi:NDP-sugar pyrophosphorylase family protein
MEYKSLKHALIMAGGRGMRMMPLTNDIPKAMAPFDGTTLIARRIEKIKNYIPNIHITVGYKGAMLAKHVIEHNVTSIFNTDGKDNCWWVFNTLIKHLNEPVVVLTCDNIVELDYKVLEEDYYKLEAPACMVVPVKPIEGLDGDYIFHEEGKVVELSRERKTDIYCSGIQILNPKKINELIKPCDNFYHLWQALISLKQLSCSNVHPEKWLAVDTIEQLRNANNTH